MKTIKDKMDEIETQLNYIFGNISIDKKPKCDPATFRVYYPIIQNGVELNIQNLTLEVLMDDPVLFEIPLIIHIIKDIYATKI